MPSLLLFVLIFAARLFMGVFECNFLEFFVNLSLDASNERPWREIVRNFTVLFLFLSFALICSKKMIMNFKACN